MLRPRKVHGFHGFGDLVNALVSVLSLQHLQRIVLGEAATTCEERTERTPTSTTSTFCSTPPHAAHAMAWAYPFEPPSNGVSDAACTAGTAGTWQIAKNYAPPELQGLKFPRDVDHQ